MSETETKYYRHGRFAVEGGTLPDAVTAYQTFGDPSKPCIVFPTCYGGKLSSQSYMIGTDKALNPEKYFIVTFALFSGGESSSPPNTPKPYNGPYFPTVTYEDNIRAQYAVLVNELRVLKIFCVIGFSMGGQQTYYWPVMYPDFVERFVCICGSARTSPHNKCFLEGPKAALTSSKDFLDGHYTSQPDIGIRAFGRAYSAWAYSQAWFRGHGYLQNGTVTYTSLDDFLRAEWEGGFDGWDANDLLTLLNTWYHGDVSRVRAVAPSLRGDLAGALGAVKARGLIMPSKTDLYFPPEDSEIEVQAMLPGLAKLVVIPSIWGHMAGGDANAEDVAFVLKEVREFLENQ